MRRIQKDRLALLLMRSGAIGTMLMLLFGAWLVHPAVGLFATCLTTFFIGVILDSEV